MITVVSQSSDEFNVLGVQRFFPVESAQILGHFLVKSWSVSHDRLEKGHLSMQPAIVHAINAREFPGRHTAPFMQRITCAGPRVQSEMLHHATRIRLSAKHFSTCAVRGETVQ